jgi:hypothetical protein
MLYTVRPSAVFGLVRTSSYAQRMVSIILPDHQTPKLLETAILISLAKVVRCRNFFEFGTLFGIQTSNIAANLGDDALAFTLDLDMESFSGAVQNDADRRITARSLQERQNLAFSQAPWGKKVVPLHGDSTRFDFSCYLNRMQMIYIDGGHDLRTLESDTANAFAMISKEELSCIAWHDFGNPTYPDLTGFLDNLASEHDLFHVEETMLCFWINHKGSDIVEVLRQKAKFRERT